MEAIKEFTRWNHSAVSWPDGTILVVGGQTGEKLANDYFIYNPKNASWIREKLPFKPRIKAGLISLNPTQALLVGGSIRPVTFDYDDTGVSRGLDDVWIFDQGKWLEKTSSANPNGSPGLVLFEGDVFVIDEYPARWIRKNEDFIELPSLNIGRCESLTTFNGVPLVHSRKGTVMWDKKAENWILLPKLSEPRFGASLVETKDGLLLIGGTVVGKGLSQRIDLFDGKKWREFGSLNVPRYHHTAIKFKENIFIIGGENEEKGMLNIEVLEAGSNKCVPVPEISFPSMMHHQVVVSLDRICVIGGWTDSGNNPTESTLGFRWLSL